MAQSKKSNNEIRAMLLKSGAINAGSSASGSFKTTDKAISQHNAIISRRREMNKIPAATVTNKTKENV